MSTAIQLIPLLDFPLVEPGDDLGQLLLDSITHNQLVLQDGDLLVLAQKVVSKAEGRYARLADVEVSAQAQQLAQETDKDPRQVELILSESNRVVRTRPGVIIVEHRLGYVHANAGIDRSNIPLDEDDPSLLLLPLDPDASAAQLRLRLQEHSGASIALIINDSSGRAWRHGTVGMAIGSAGMVTVTDQIGDPDLFGRSLEVTEVAVADELAAAASFLMGQADEGCPVVLIRGAKWQAAETGSSALLRDPNLDMFR